MAPMREYDLKPYAIWHSPSYSTQWVRVTELDEHPGDLEAFVRAQRGWTWTGQWRLVSQHVVEQTGIVEPT